MIQSPNRQVCTPCVCTHLSTSELSLWHSFLSSSASISPDFHEGEVTYTYHGRKSIKTSAEIGTIWTVWVWIYLSLCESWREGERCCEAGDGEREKADEGRSIHCEVSDCVFGTSGFGFWRENGMNIWEWIRRKLWAEAGIYTFVIPRTRQA